MTAEDLDPRVRDAISAGLAQPHEEVEGVNGASMGWVLTSLSLAIAALVDRRPAAQVLLDVVRLVGDADTNGAIVGGLLGARDGVAAWPDRWLEALEHGGELRAAARTFARR